MTPLDAHLARRLLVGHSPNGEVAAASPEFRGVLSHLAAQAPGHRPEAWAGFLASRPDSDAIVSAVARADPNGPAPVEAEATEGDGWPPLRLGALPPAVAFPLHALPLPAAALAGEAAAAIGCDAGFLGASMLAVAGGLIGNSARLLLSPGRFAAAVLYQASVGPPGDGKSGATEYVQAPAVAIEDGLAEEFAARKAAYLEALDRHQAEAKGPGGEGAGKPAPPVPRRILVFDATWEASCRIHADPENRRGLLMIHDELSTLLSGMNQYKGGRGSDLANIIRAWTGAPVSVDRVMNQFREPLRIPHPHYCVTGNLTPAGLSDLVSPRGDDGFLDRWLIVYPERRDRPKSAERRPVSEEAVEAWDSMCRRIWARQPREREGMALPHVLRLTDRARAEFDRRHDLHVDEVNDRDFPEELRGAWSKLEGYAGRICLILALMRDAADPTSDPSTVPEVTADVAADAWALIDYFKVMARRVRAQLRGRGVGMPEGARLALNWIGNHPEATRMSLRDLTRSYPPERGYDRPMMADGLAYLERQNALRPILDPEKDAGKRGRPRTPGWEFHPELREYQRKQQNQRNSSTVREGSDAGQDFADSAVSADDHGTEETCPPEGNE